MVAAVKTFFLVFILSMAMVPVSAVRAQEDEATQNTTQTEEEPDETADGESVDPSEPLTLTPEQKKEKRTERIAEYKQNAAEKLAAAKSARIVARCKGAQGKITSLKNRLSESITNRTSVYQEIEAKVTTLIDRLKAAEVDTTDLETLLADMQTELAALTTSMSDYITVLEDLEAMDCAGDPEAFYAALQAARTELASLKEQVASFRGLVATELKALLQTVRETLQSTQGEPETQEDKVTDTEGV